MIVTLYRIESGFRNVSDGISVSKPGSEYIYTEQDYDLPEGYHLGVDDLGATHIYDGEGYEATPVLRSNRRGAAVFLVPNRGDMVPIKKAKAPEKHIPLRAARIASGLTQQQLANLSGVNVRQIQRVELGEAEAGNLTAKNLLSIADVLHVDPRELVSDEG